MALVFDSLGYSRKLREAGIPQEHADAMAEAARDHIMLELVTKTDLQHALDTQTLRLSVRMGIMLGAAVAALAALVRLT
jgi:alcohol dehydrogenase YqhD (iron-dependent ADH family)